MTEFVDLMRGRSAFYSFFATVFKKPLESCNLEFVINSAEYFKTLAEELGSAELKNGAELLCLFSDRAAKQTHNGGEALFKELNIAYTSLFLLGHDSIRYTESSFLSRAGLWKQKPWEEVKEIYRQNRFMMPADFKEPEDHIAIELLFMSAISDLTAKSIEEENDKTYGNCINVQHSFLHGHLLKWAPDFCDRITAKSAGGTDGHGLYKSSAMLLKGYLVHDSAVLEEFVRA